MIRILFVCLGLFISQPVSAQNITVDVWTLTRPRTPPQPSNVAAVRISTAANVPPGPAANPQRPTAGGSMQNQYVLDASQLGSLVDITTRQLGHHPWTARDLYVGSGGDQKIHVQLFEYDYPIKAPQCFALKTEYELLFRKEQRYSPHADRSEIQHLARVKYADGLLALPNPSRQHVQSPETRQMLAEMTDDDRDELNDMIRGVFDLYDMDGFVQFAPSTWRTRYMTPGGDSVDSEVKIHGNHGIYVTTDGREHLLENIDIFYEEDNDGNSANVIAGTWRFAPNTGSESSGTFRWKVDGGETHFDGFWQRQGDNNRRSWEGDRVDSMLNEGQQ